MGGRLAGEPALLEVVRQVDDRRVVVVGLNHELPEPVVVVFLGIGQVHTPSEGIELEQRVGAPILGHSGLLSSGSTVSAAPQRPGVQLKKGLRPDQPLVPAGTYARRSPRPRR